MMQSMELFFAPSSPYVRKVMACAIELGVEDKIVCLPSAANPIKRDTRIAAFNPLAKVPAAKLDDGTLLFDSRVICEYLNDAAGGTLVPSGAERWRVLTEQALGDGLLDAALLARYEETSRAPDQRSEVWRASQMTKIDAALDHMEETVEIFGSEVTIGCLTIASSLGYLDFRFSGVDWRSSRPKLASWYADFILRPSMSRTAPHE
jgi:glutathione S-transferase